MANRYWVSATDDVWTANKWATTSGGAPGASMPGPSDVAYFDNGGAGWCTLNTDVTINGINIAANYPARFVDGGWTLTIGSGGITKPDAFKISSTGTWKLTANCNVGPGDGYNVLYRLELAPSITVTITGWCTVQKVKLGTNALLTGQPLAIQAYANDPIDLAAGSNIALEIYFYIQTAGTIQQKAMVMTAALNVNYSGAVTYQATGHWTIGGLAIFGNGDATPPQRPESTAACVDMNGYNLYCEHLQLGNFYPAGPYDYLGKILFGSGSHVVNGNIAASQGNYRCGIVDFGTSTVEIRGSFDAKSMDLRNVATATLRFTGSSPQSVWCNGKTLPNVVVAKTGSAFYLEDTARFQSLDLQAIQMHMQSWSFSTVGNCTIRPTLPFVFASVPGKTITVGGRLSIPGTSGSHVNLQFGSAWYLNVTGFALADYADVTNCNSGGGQPVWFRNCTGSSNTNWNVLPSNRFWVSSVAAGFSADQWAAVSGGPAGAPLPGASDTVYFNSGGSGNCTLGGNISIAGINLAANYGGTFNDGGFTISIGASGVVKPDAAKITSTGIWRFTATSSIVGVDYTNAPAKIEIAAGCTVTLSGAVTACKALKVEAGAVLSGGWLYVWNYANDPLDIVSGGDVTSSVVLQAFVNRTQKAFTMSGSLVVNLNSHQLQATGNWNTGSAHIYGPGIPVPPLVDEASASVVDMNGHNWTVNGTLTLGNHYAAGPYDYLGKLTVGSGTVLVTGWVACIYGDWSRRTAIIDYGGGGTLEVRGDFNATAMEPRNQWLGKLKLSGSGTQHLDGGGTNLPGILVAKSAGILILSTGIVPYDLDFQTAGIVYLNDLLTYDSITLRPGCPIAPTSLTGKSLTAWGDFNCLGASGAHVDLRAGGRWYLSVSGSALAWYTDVSWCDASASTPIVATVYGDYGNNLGWVPNPAAVLFDLQRRRLVA